jgi:hypothetical protein
MVVSEFIEWLKTQDQDAIVQVVVGDDMVDYQCIPVVEEFSIDEHLYLWEYTDLRGNRFVKTSDSCYNKSYLLLGSA